MKVLDNVPLTYLSHADLISVDDSGNPATIRGIISGTSI